ncbi:MAG: sigma-70 family RNA polymerase sigma factor [Lentisphaeraceae bacterium]|nr:sigma-70 family RNA polymerase sigma factor [Lentisphaeraceae bacterium]
MSDKEKNFYSLYAKHQRKIYSYIYNHVSNPVDTDDVMQQTSVALWESFEQFEEGTNFMAWACKVAHFRILRYRQSQKRNRLVLSDEIFNLLDREFISKAAELENRTQALAECLKQVHPEDRRVFETVYNKELSIKDAASQLNRKVKGLYKLMSKLKDRLKLCVDKRLSYEH